MYYTYVLHCTKQGTKYFYIGYCRNLKVRLAQHQKKQVPSTSHYATISLIYYEACLLEEDAIRREKQLKTGFGRGFIKRRLETYLNSNKNEPS